MSTAAAKRPVWIVLLSAATIVGMAMGLRQVMGLYLKPIAQDLGIGREPFSNAMALANLTWGLLSIGAGRLPSGLFRRGGFPVARPAPGATAEAPPV